MTRREQDRAARRAAQLVFDRALVLEAGAGTGKTATLVARILTWSTGPGWEMALAGMADLRPEEITSRAVAARVQRGIVAITFTEAAAAELEERIGQGLLAVVRGQTPPGVESELLPPDASSRAASLHDELARLQVSTIHGFCHRILADHPLEASLPPKIEVDAEGDLMAEQTRLLLEEQLPTAYGEEGSPVLALAARGIGPARLEETLLKLAQEDVHPNRLLEDPWSESRSQALLQNILSTSNRVLASGIRELALAKRSPTSMHVLDALIATEQILLADGDPRSKFAALPNLWPDKIRDRLKKWAQEDWNKTEGDLLGAHRQPAAQAVSELAPPLLHLLEADPDLLDDARKSLEPLLRLLRSRLDERGILSFSALLQRSVELLGENPPLLARRRRGIEQLLVDEFQDTDLRQIELVRLLALTGPREERPGLALVGDPKQSIYGWRNADLAAYEGFVKEVLEAGGERHRLSVNFRSAPPILDEVERSIAPIMLGREGLQPPYQSLESAGDRQEDPGFVEGDFRPVEIWACWDPNKGAGPSAGEGTEIEARALAEDLLRLHDDHGVPWKEVGILFRATGDLDRYLTELRRAGIPFEVERDRNYYRRREIIDAAALVRCVLDPTDHLALVSMLRSSWIGVPDAALIPLWERSFPKLVGKLHGPDPRLLEELAQQVRGSREDLGSNLPGMDLLPRWSDSLCTALGVLAVLRASSHDDPADLFVERLRRLTLFEVSEAARHLGAYRAANLERFFRRLLIDLDDVEQDRYSVLRKLRTSVGEARDEEEARPPEAESNAVKLMSIHRAKGLDFSHVYLLQMGKQSRKGSQEETEFDGSGEYRLLGSATPGYYEVTRRKEAVAAAETIRTLYVAMTRARIRLVLSGVWPAPGTRSDSHLSLLASDRLHTPLAERFDPAQPRFEDDFGVIWRFLLEQERSPRRPPRSGTSLQLEDPGRIERDGAQLLVARIAAEARSKRPILATSTTELYPHAASSDRKLPREIAASVGTIVHNALEELDLDDDPAEQLLLLAEGLKAPLDLPAEEAREALEKAGGLLTDLAHGPLVDRLIEIRHNIVGREVPILTHPDLGPEGPVGARVGRIDLIYLDPEDGCPVVVDFKTEAVHDPEEIESRVVGHRPQLELYRRAVAECFDGHPAPRAEIWFIANHSILPVP